MPQQAVAISALVYSTTVVVFAVIYGLMDKAGNGKHFHFQNKFVDPLYFSVTTAVTVGYGDVVAQTATARLVVIAQFAVMSVMLLTAVVCVASKNRS